MKERNHEEQTIICRCSDVTLQEIRDLIREGYTEADELKRLLRTGMGPCQGRTCGPIIMREIQRMTGKAIEDQRPFTARPPVKGVLIGEIAKGDSDD